MEDVRRHRRRSPGGTGGGVTAPRCGRRSPAGPGLPGGGGARAGRPARRGPQRPAGGPRPPPRRARGRGRRPPLAVRLGCAGRLRRRSPRRRRPARRAGPARVTGLRLARSRVGRTTGRAWPPAGRRPAAGGAAAGVVGAARLPGRAGALPCSVGTTPRTSRCRRRCTATSSGCCSCSRPWPGRCMLGRRKLPRPRRGWSLAAAGVLLVLASIACRARRAGATCEARVYAAAWAPARPECRTRSTRCSRGTGRSPTSSRTPPTARRWTACCSTTRTGGPLQVGFQQWWADHCARVLDQPQAADGVPVPNSLPAVLRAGPGGRGPQPQHPAAAAVRARRTCRGPRSRCRPSRPSRPPLPPATDRPYRAPASTSVASPERWTPQVTRRLGSTRCGSAGAAAPRARGVAVNRRTDGPGDVQQVPQPLLDVGQRRRDRRRRCGRRGCRGRAVRPRAASPPTATCSGDRPRQGSVYLTRPSNSTATAASSNQASTTPTSRPPASDLHLQLGRREDPPR